MNKEDQEGNSIKNIIRLKRQKGKIKAPLCNRNFENRIYCFDFSNGLPIWIEFRPETGALSILFLYYCRILGIVVPALHISAELTEIQGTDFTSEEKSASYQPPHWHLVNPVFTT